MELREIKARLDGILETYDAHETEYSPEADRLVNGVRKLAEDVANADVPATNIPETKVKGKGGKDAGA